MPYFSFFKNIYIIMDGLPVKLYQIFSGTSCIKQILFLPLSLYFSHCLLCFSASLLLTDFPLSMHLSSFSLSSFFLSHPCLCVLFLLCFSISLPYPLHNSSQIIAVRNSKYRKNIGDIRQFYQEQHQNWYVIDGFHSKWWVWNEVIKKVKMVNKHMQIYLERTKAGKKTGNP